MGDLRGSLYDLFGYFIPGLTAGIGGWLLLWSLAWRSSELSLAPVEEPAIILLLILLFYTCGHLVQAIGNRSSRLQGLDTDRALSEGYAPNQTTRIPNVVLSQATLEIIDQTLKTRFGTEFLRLPPRDRFAFIDEARILSEREGDREVYIYHHGFYRGMIVATLILILGLASRLLSPKSCIGAGGDLYCIGRLEVLLVSSVAAGSVYGFWFRLQRFAEYRLVRAVMLWLTFANYVEKPVPEEPPHNNTN